jgi:hypothetical protein
VDRREPHVSALLGTILVGGTFLFFALRSPRPWTALGLALMAFAAYLATPDLIGRPLVAAHHPAARLVGRVLAAPFRTVRYVTLMALALAAGVLIGLGITNNAAATGALAVALAIAFSVGLIEFIRFGVRDMGRTVSSGGHIDARLEERYGPHLRLTIAGLTFLAGTVLQMVGTYVE